MELVLEERPAEGFLNFALARACVLPAVEADDADDLARGVEGRGGGRRLGGLPSPAGPGRAGGSVSVGG